MNTVNRFPITLALLAALALASCGEPSDSASSAEEVDAKEAAAASGNETKETAEKPTNHLAGETSPYLLQHVHNPVDWYPWAPEAFAKAREESKLIFLSIGYSSCHWCHVMERESFEDEEIAAVLNEHYVCIKVDREERPDVDEIYMTALQVFNRAAYRGAGGGGWPLSMFLTPAGEPFFGATYLPPRDGQRGRMPGFLTVITKVNEAWHKEPDSVKKNAELITEMTRKELEARLPQALVPVDQSVIDRMMTQYGEAHDPTYGGFGYSDDDPRRPKFPEPSNLSVLLDVVESERGTPEQQRQARDMLVHTLDNMARGGIRDHVGGGFHRYSVDRFWTVPHFEKMLYDNAQLAGVFARAYAVTGREEFQIVAEEILEFVTREMTDESGAFYAAIDADSEGEEGRFYRWERDEVEKLLPQDRFALFASTYGLDAPPNFEENYYVLRLAEPKDAADDGDDTEDDDAEDAEGESDADVAGTELHARLAPLRAALLEARQQRVRPLTDTKIITSWNGLMIRGFADCGRILRDDRYVAAAERAAQFLLDHLRTDDGRLLRTYAGGSAKLNAYLDDYAFLADGLIAIHQATGDAKWLRAADELTQRQIELFWDEASGGFFFTSDDHESLLARGKKSTDGVIPSGNSVSVGNLLFLAQALDKPDYREKAERTLKTVSGLLIVSPTSAPRMVEASAPIWSTAVPPEEKSPAPEADPKDPFAPEDAPAPSNEPAREESPASHEAPPDKAPAPDDSPTMD
jgi:hypothetical protein